MKNIFGNLRLKSPQSPKTSVNIMDVKVFSTNIAKVLEQAQHSVETKTPFFISTPNPEIVLLAQKDRDFKNTLETFSLAVPDGVGLLAAERFLQMPRVGLKPLRHPLYLLEGLLAGLSLLMPFGGRGRLQLIKGRVLAWKLLKLANDNRWKVYLLDDKTVLDAKRKLDKQFPNINMRAAVGAQLDANAKPINNKQYKKDIYVTKDIKKFAPEILFVGFGAPKQERWIAKHAKKLNAKVVMCVGGTFHRYTVKPWLYNVAVGPFEWLLRLFTSTNSIKRILNATIVFPWKMYLYKVRYG